MSRVVASVDGACVPNPGAGGWGVVLEASGLVKERSGFADECTNQRAELLAAIEAFGALKRRCSIEVRSDSAYLIDAFKQGRIEQWRASGFDRINGDLWQELDGLVRGHSVDWVKVKGHSGDRRNNRAHWLANNAIRLARDMA